METIYKKARAKINLTLNVIDKREDGYHNLESVFQKISLYDEIYISKTNEHTDIKIEVNKPELDNEENIIFKAYKLLKSKFDKISGVNVVLKKNIPMQAGLGGGSTDCASFIKGMNELFKLNLTQNEMIEIGAQLGADVPPTLYDVPVIARGIGEIIEEISSKAKYYILLIKPKISCSTKEMFRKIDEEKEKVQKYNTEAMKKALEEGNIEGISNNLYNIFEAEVENIDEIKKDMLDVGAVGSLMTGAGSTIFGVFANKEQAKKGYEKLFHKYKTYYCISKNKEKK